MKSTRRQNQISDSGRMPAEHRRPQPCIRAADWEPLLYDYAEGLADRETAASVERHIAECDYCRGALEDIRWMMSALQTSVPEPQNDVVSRVMKTVCAEEEEHGRVIAETVDTRTGRVLSSPDQRRGVRRLLRTVGSLAAALVIVIGLIYVLPLLKSGSGASSGAQDVIREMQDSEESSFSGGAFVGSTPTTEAAETEADAFGAVTGNKSPAVSEPVLEQTPENRYPIVLRIIGLSDAQLRDALSALTAADGTPITVRETADGYLISPLSAFETAQQQLHAVYPAFGIEIVRAETVPESYTDDAFYIQIREP